MSRLFKKPSESRKSLWRKAVDLALSDVRVLAGRSEGETLEDLEERLLAADFGVQATLALMDRVESLTRRGKARGPDAVVAALREGVAEVLADGENELRAADAPPTVYLVVGVNGVGKTTSVAKIAHRLCRQGSSVVLAAADTYRAGAVEQLGVWAERVGATFVRGQQGGDPAAVAYDALEAGVSRGADVVLIDTAGRLHTHRNLMEELRKVDRVVRRRVDGAPHETLLVLDATVGQNALRQVAAFHEAVGLTGIVLAKMDSSARGGMVVALQQEYGVPVKLVGTGEGIEDLEAFDAQVFVSGVFDEA